MAVAGVGFALYRRELALPLIVASGAIAAVVIALRYTIYLEAKGYAILAPALAIAAAAGVFALLARPGKAQNIDAAKLLLSKMIDEPGIEGRRARLEAARLMSVLPDAFDRDCEQILDDNAAARRCLAEVNGVDGDFCRVAKSLLSLG